MQASGEICPSPLLIYDLPEISLALSRFEAILEGLPATLLYSVKACPHLALLDHLRPRVGGFSLSSVFEARLAMESLAKDARQDAVLHLTSPGLRSCDWQVPCPLTHISFNSLEQMERLSPEVPETASIGLRINPGLSAIQDPRYDPCRQQSKLGIPLEALATLHSQAHPSLDRVEGLHFHSHFRSREADGLDRTLKALETRLEPLFPQLQWINLGGGYAPRSDLDILGFRQVIEAFSHRFRGRIFLEPGHALIGEAGTLRATVIDTFSRDGMAIAVLDTGVHHLPEVFEYQRPPQLLEQDPSGAYSCLLAGESCLAGDIFGCYPFQRLPVVGDTLNFIGVGAYSLVKSSRFNGHDFPSIGFRDSDRQVRIIKRHGFDAYRDLWS